MWGLRSASNRPSPVALRRAMTARASGLTAVKKPNPPVTCDTRCHLTPGRNRYRPHSEMIDRLRGDPSSCCCVAISLSSPGRGLVADSFCAYAASLLLRSEMCALRRRADFEVPRGRIEVVHQGTGFSWHDRGLIVVSSERSNGLERIEQVQDGELGLAGGLTAEYVGSAAAIDTAQFGQNASKQQFLVTVGFFQWAAASPFTADHNRESNGARFARRDLVEDAVLAGRWWCRRPGRW